MTVGIWQVVLILAVVLALVLVLFRTLARMARPQLPPPFAGMEAGPREGGTAGDRGQGGASAFESAIREAKQDGWRVEDRQEDHVVMAKGERVPHVIHLVLSVLTGGVWIAVWVLHCLAGGKRQVRLVALPDGTVTASPISRLI